MKLFRDSAARSLAARLRSERRLRLKAEAERDDYRDRWIKLAEYAALTEGRPRFSVVEPHEPRAPVTEMKTFAEIEQERQERYTREFEDYRAAHPELSN